MVDTSKQPQAPVAAPTGNVPTPSTFKPSGPAPTARAQTANTLAAAPAPASAPAPATQDAVKVQIVTETGPTRTPETAAPDGTDPSQYPADGTSLEGLMGASRNAYVGGDAVAPAVTDGNPPPYDAEAKHGLVEEPSESAGRLPVHCKIADLIEGKTVYKLGVSHPPYVVEAAGKGFAVLRAGTGGTVQITNDSEASFFTEDQKRQYAVADGNPNVSGDVKHP